MLQEMLDESIAVLKNTRARDGSVLNVHSVIVSDLNEVVKYDFVSRPSQIDIHSVTKVVTCLTIGQMISRHELIGDETLSLDMPIYPHLASLPAFRDREIDKKWTFVRLRHLLSCTIGHQTGLLFRKDLPALENYDLLDYLFSQPLNYAPGTYFAYSNAGTFLASALIEESTGRAFSEWATQLVLEPLSFGPTMWLKYGKYDAACSGLSTTIEDMHKLGELLRDGGMRGAQRITEHSWVDQMIGPIIETRGMYESQHAFPKFAYGMGIWSCGNGVYFCDGSDGQYLIVLPKTGIVISVTSIQPDMEYVPDCFRNFTELENTSL